MAAHKEASQETLRTEYSQIHKTRIEYIKTLLQIVVLYLAITGVTFDYAIGESSLTPKFYVAAIFDIVIGGFGATVMFIADNHINKLSFRLKQVCKKLKIVDNGDKLYKWPAKVIFCCYVLVVVGWIYIYSLVK